MYELDGRGRRTRRVAPSGTLPVLRKVTDVLEGYSTDARRVVSLATAEARQLGHSRVGTEHLLLGLLADSESDTAAALRAAGATLAGARFTVSEVVTETVDARGDDELPYTPRAQRALERAGRFARRSRDPEVTPDHVLLGVLDVEGLACQVMRGLGVDLARLRESIAPREPASEFAVADPQPEQQELAPTMRPRCPNCYAELDGNLVETVVVARRDDGTTTDVRVAFCLACGATLGALRAEQT
jgi:ATP-dependent Clp protease ATP-binding subunit ClpA